MYDINISCHEDQLDWIESNLLPILEKKLHLHCFLPERDGKAGVSFLETTKSKCDHFLFWMCLPIDHAKCYSQIAGTNFLELWTMTKKKYYRV